MVGRVLTRKRANFPRNVRYGDIVRGLPLPEASCRAIYASHVIEHLSFEDARRALAETRRILHKTGRFRVVVPDLQILADRYLEKLSTRNPCSSVTFMRDSRLGIEHRNHGIRGLAEQLLGNAAHRWMWDSYSLAAELRLVGFTRVRQAKFGDSEESAFRDVEAESRFRDAVALEARP